LNRVAFSSRGGGEVLFEEFPFVANYDDSFGRLKNGQPLEYVVDEGGRPGLSDSLWGVTAQAFP
jgi:hypothetical protein